jgi:hypothetical protein
MEVKPARGKFRDRFLPFLLFGNFLALTFIYIFTLRPSKEMDLVISERMKTIVLVFSPAKRACLRRNGTPSEWGRSGCE